jgi:DNA-binding XRE family transcriptional regulator
MRLVLDCDGTETTANLAGGSLAALPVGTLVSASGVAMLRYAPSDLVAEFSKPTRLDLLLRDGNDIAVIQAAPWWTARRALIALGVMLLIAGAALAWSMALGRTVRRQTAVIRDQLSRETLLQERTRMARELHDTVEQELMGLSLQLEAAGDTLPDSPDTAQRALLTGQALLKHTRAEVRRSIWDLRAPEFERRDLETAVRETVGPLSSPGGPEIAVEVTGTARRMPGAVEVHVLRIALEALQIYKMTRVGFFTEEAPAEPLLPQSLGDHLRVCRIERKMHQQQVADVLGVHRITVTAWERNRRVPAAPFADKIKAFLHAGGYHPARKS